MARIHLFEIEDQQWVPALLRDYATDVLQWNQTVIDQTESLTPKITAALDASGAERIIDLCSGGSGPLLPLAERLSAEGRDTPILMTDKFPNLEAFEKVQRASGGRIEFSETSVDATNTPPELTGLRTLFNGFHHFEPEAATGILHDAVSHRQPIAIFELVDRTPLAMLGILIAALIVVPLTVPFHRPFRLSRLFFTYIVPVLPLFVLWDGIVSCLRIYSPSELQALCDALPENDYRWEIGKLANPRGPIKVTYLVGVPG